MKRSALSVLVLLTAATLLWGCGGGGFSQSGSTNVTVSVGSVASTAAAGPRGATIPSEVASLRLTVSSTATPADMTPIVSTLAVAPGVTTYQLSVTVPNGSRRFLLEAFDNTSTLRYRGDATMVLTGGTASLTIQMYSDVTPPSVLSVSPVSGATGVAVSSPVTVTFSEAMDTTTVTGATFTVTAGGTPVPGTVGYSGTTATFTPTGNWNYSTSYAVTVTTGAEDLAGNAIASAYTWSFTTLAPVGTVSAPGFSPVAGTYTSAQSVTLSTSTSGAGIRYTTDGSTPTSTTGTVYSVPIAVSATTTIKAFAFLAGWADSAVTSGTYTILGTNTASGTGAWNSATGVLSMTWTSSNFTCNGPDLGTQTNTGVTITSTTMTWPNDGMTWSRPSGTANDIVGTWTSSDSTGGNSYTLTVNANGTFSLVGVIVSCGSGASARAQHWSNGYYYVVHEYDDSPKTATSVSVTGPGITGSKALTYNTLYGHWDTWTLPSTPVNFGTTSPTGLPFTYTFSITDTTTWTATSTVSCFQEQFATNLSPTGTVTGTPTFSWTGIGDSSATYGVELHDSNNNLIWSTYNISGTSIAYSGPALTSGATYDYFVSVMSSSACRIQSSFASGSFTYQVTFSQTDLTGTWDYVFFDIGRRAGWERGTATVNSSGGVIVTSTLGSDGDTTLPAPGSIILTISAAGVVSESGSGGNASFHGQMSSNKQLVFGTESWGTDNTVALRVFRKRTGTAFTSADLANKTITFHVLRSGTDNTWSYGAGSTDGSGLITITSEINPSGPGSPVPPGTASLSSAGIMTLSLDNTFYGLMTDDKKVIFFIDSNSSGAYSFGVITVTGQTYIQSDYAGIYNFSVIRNTVPNPVWAYGVVSVDAAGTGAYLSYTDSGGVRHPRTSPGYFPRAAS